MAQGRRPRRRRRSREAGTSPCSPSLPRCLLATRLADLPETGRPSTPRTSGSSAQAVAPASGDEAARSVPSGIQQVWLPQTGGANRCVSCHLATTWRGFEAAAEPLRTHRAGHPPRAPVERFGCTLCHGGQGWAVDRVRAHGKVPYWDGAAARHARWPAGLVPGADGKRAASQLRCNVCHRYERETAGMPVDQPRQAAGGPEGVPGVPSHQRARRPHRARPRLDRRQEPRPVRLQPPRRPARARSAGTPRISRIRARSCRTR